MTEFFLNWSIEIAFGLVIIYNVHLIAKKYLYTNKDTVTGDELIVRYVKMLEYNNRRKK